MVHFRVVLQAVEAAGGALDRDDRALFGRRDGRKPFRQRHRFIPVAHPHVLAVIRLLFEEVRVLGGANPHPPILAAAARCLHFAAQRVHDELHAVADAEDRDLGGVDPRPKAGGEGGRAVGVDRIGAARQDDGRGRHALDAVLGRGRCVRRARGGRAGRAADWGDSVRKPPRPRGTPNPGGCRPPAPATGAPRIGERIADKEAAATPARGGGGHRAPPPILPPSPSHQLRVPRQQHGVDPLFPHAARDELGILGTIVQDEHRVVRGRRAAHCGERGGVGWRGGVPGVARRARPREGLCAAGSGARAPRRRRSVPSTAPPLPLLMPRARVPGPPGSDGGSVAAALRGGAGAGADEARAGGGRARGGWRQFRGRANASSPATDCCRTPSRRHSEQRRAAGSAVDRGGRARRARRARVGDRPQRARRRGARAR